MCNNASTTHPSRLHDLTLRRACFDFCRPYKQEFEELLYIVLQVNQANTRNGRTALLPSLQTRMRGALVYSVACEPRKSFHFKPSF